MKSTKLEVGKTYRIDGETFTATQVMGPDSAGRWYALDGGTGAWDFDPEFMPEEVGPVCPWVVRAERRAARKGDWLIVHGGLLRAPSDGNHPEWVLVIELDPLEAS